MNLIQKSKSCLISNEKIIRKIMENELRYLNILEYTTEILFEQVLMFNVDNTMFVIC